MSRREKFLLAVTVLAVSFSLFDLHNLPTVNAKENQSRLFDELRTFTDVLSLVQDDYVRPVKSDELVEGAIKGMLSSLDPHSGYLDPDFYGDLRVQTKGEFGGLGIEITMQDKLLKVIAPMEESPAAKVGVKAGDVIVKINGKFIKNVSLVDAVKQLRGKRGSKVDISVQRDGESKFLDFTIVRDIIKVRSVRGRYLSDGIGYIRISQFVEKTSGDLKKTLEKVRSEAPSKKLKGLVLDLRNNPGGLLTQAVRVSDMFLKEGVVVYTESRLETQRQEFFAHSQGTEPEYPIVVIVNGGSASASEIVSGSLQDHGRGLVLGTQTFGKGSVQTITPLDNGGALTLTTALYFTKSGRSIQAKGVTPDIILEYTDDTEGEKEETRLRVREGDLPGAIENPDGAEDDGKGKQDGSPNFILTKPEELEVQKFLQTDRQVSRAFELLKTFNVFGGKKPFAELAKESASQ